jgi:hypothetical protein
MQDFSALGVNTREDRQRLFELIQAIRDEYESLHGSGSSATVTRRYERIGGGPTMTRRPSRSHINTGTYGRQEQSLPSPRGHDGANNYYSSASTGSVFNQRQESDEEEPVPKVRSRPALNAYGVPKRSANSGTTGRSGGSSTSKTSAAAKNSVAYDKNLTQKIRVCVRKRPLNKRELAKNETDIIEVVSRQCLTVNEPK